MSKTSALVWSATMPRPPPSRTTSRPSGCRSPRTARSRPARAWSPAPRTSITTPPRASRSSTRHAAGCGAPAPAFAQPIVEAIQKQAAELDFAPTFQFGHPKAFELASRIAALAPGDLDHVFFCNSGSEAADTALKMAIAYWHARGKASKTRLIGRERGYHGVGFGGITVGGIVANRRVYGSMLAAPTTCRTPITARSRPSPRASQSGAPISPTSWSASSPCTTPRRLPPSWSSRWPAPPACCRRRSAT